MFYHLSKNKEFKDSLKGKLIENFNIIIKKLIN